MSDYTPSLLVGQNYYVTGRAQITGEHAQDITPYSAEFNRMIEAVRAEERGQAAREPSDAYVATLTREFRRVWDERVEMFDPEEHDETPFIEGIMRAALLAAQEVRRG